MIHTLTKLSWDIISAKFISCQKPGGIVPASGVLRGGGGVWGGGEVGGVGR